ncbi:hypothetical protein [Treponema sp.]|uniref:hypothetical protein n=1 Tax=Treponema sp. TaxID=166 RepID=UPI0025FB0D1C|nr:hypothetical protein [Treponema sp.]MCR5217483.1 hypothetical protein [Treponema sp.]
MNKLQEEIAKALTQLSDKSLITEAILTKKIRQNLKIESKNKAGLSFTDVEEALSFIEENNNLHFSLHANSANDLLIKAAENTSLLDTESRKRRLSSQKSMTLLTEADIKNALSGKSGRGPKAKGKRTEKKSLNINRSYDDWEQA